MSNISAYDYCIFNISPKARKVEKHKIYNSNCISSQITAVQVPLSFFSEIVPYSSQDAIYITIVASVIFSLLSFLPDVNLQCLEDASPVREQQATSYLCDENHNFEELGRFLKRHNGNGISFPLSLALFLVIY